MYGSSPVSPLAARAASGALRMASAARYTPAGQPSVRWTSAPTVSSEESTPAWARTARASSSVNARSSRPNSTKAVLAAQPAEAEHEPGPDHQVEARREAGGERADEVHGLDGAQLVDVVEHQHTGPVPVPQGREQVRQRDQMPRPIPDRETPGTPPGPAARSGASARATCPASRTGSPSASSTVTQANSRESSAAHWLSTVVFPYPAGAVSRMSEV